MNSEPRASEEEALSTLSPNLGSALIQLESFQNIQYDLERATFPVNIPIYHVIVKLIKSWNHSWLPEQQHAQPPIPALFFNHFTAKIVTGFSETLSLKKNSLSVARASTRTKNWEFVRVCTICTSPYPYKN